MKRLKDKCPHPKNIEPVCLNFSPSTALAHAQRYAEKFRLDSVRPAIGLIIPSALNPNQILYGLRNPKCSEEFPNVWGLPSTSISIYLCRKLALPNGNMNTQVVSEVIDVLTNKKQKLPHVSLVPEKIVGWTGRIRLRSAGYNGNYYLVMIDVRTRPINPNTIPKSSVAYTEFSWLSPDEHKKITEDSSSRAYGACTALAYEVFQHENLLK